MSRETMTKTLQVRMRPDLRDALDRRAEELQLRPSQFVRLSLALAAVVDPEVHEPEAEVGDEAV